MSEKEQRVAMLHADLMAGRIKVPEQGAWMREYLGEWKDPPPGPLAIAVESSIGIHAVRCESCGLAFTGATASEANFHAKAHHAVCTARSIAVGDPVRWDYGPTGPFAMPTNWAEGEVTAIDKYHATIRVERCGLGKRVGQVIAFGIGPGVDSTIRRIPRPEVGAAQARPFRAGDKVRIVRTTTTLLHGALGTLVHIDESEGGMPYRVTVDAEKDGYEWWCYEVEHADRPAAPPICAPGCQCGAHGLAAWLPVAATVHPTVKEAGRYIEPPAQVLVDGLTPAQCLAEYSLRQNGIDRRAVLTPAQLAAAREEWSAALRAKVAASREADAAREPRVVVTPEVDPWD